MPLPPPVFGCNPRQVHLLGAGGMGMAPLSLYLGQLGFVVSGEDDAWSSPVRGIVEEGGLQITAAGGQPAETELVIYSPAVAAAHPSRRHATSLGVPQVRRGEMFAEVTRGKKLLAVAGSHGKTTTTAMLVTVLHRAGFECGWLLGGLFNNNALPPARASGAAWVVAEIDESDDTINLFTPEVTLVVNLDWDHTDHYAKLADLEVAFASLFCRTKSSIFLSDACALSARLAARGNFAAPVATFGRTGDYTCRLSEDHAAGQKLGLGGKFSIREAVVRAHGEFNAANAVAALAVAQQMGAKINADSLAGFAGVHRRQALLHASSIKIYEDYAHHPTEIRALLATLRRAAQGRLLVVFQPHRFTRTAQFKTELAASLAAADQVFLMDVYAASELPVAGGTSADIYAESKKSGAGHPVVYLPGDASGLMAALRGALQPDDTVVFVGAGDIEQTAREFVAQWQAAEKREAAWSDFVVAVRGRLGAETKFTERELLGPKTTMRVGGPARVYAEPISVEELRQLLLEAHRRGLPVLMLGRGSNVIIPDAGVDGLVISLGHENWQRFTPQPDGRIWAGAGLRLKNLCGLATKAGLLGFEFLEGIPGSVGGGLRMNAGAMGGWMFDVVDEVQLMTMQGELRSLKKAEMHLDYRHCGELQEAIALGAYLKSAATGASTDIRRQIDIYQKKRVESQPREPSAGCIFKNPPNGSAGKLIDETALKGLRVGDAEVSTVHANFIVNRGHATSADIIGLVREVRARVKAARGVELEPEVLLFGEAWRNVL